MYIGYDGIGYQTALSVSEDMVCWKTLGVILPRSGNGWDKVGRAVSCALHDNRLYGNRELLKINGRYWMFYHSYPGEGYEVEPAANDIAWMRLCFGKRRTVQHMGFSSRGWIHHVL